MNDVFVTRLPLPYSVRGLVTPTADGDYQIVLNSRYDETAQRQIYDHEIRHILLGHLHTAERLPLALAERQAAEPALLPRAALRRAALTGIRAGHFVPGHRMAAPSGGQPEHSETAESLPPAGPIVPCAAPRERAEAKEEHPARGRPAPPCSGLPRGGRHARGLLCGLYL